MAAALRRKLVVPFVSLLFAIQADAYSVLTHQEIVDRDWAQEIKPRLLKRFPGATEEQLRRAHAYAYGGAILQDFGYYPFSNKFFSDLVHYVRSGDFILALVEGAQDLNEYAFALGSLAHYAADNEGHPAGINRAVPLIYPKLLARYGPVVTYEDAPSKHLKAEFGFDVIEVARGHYVSEAYHDFIGFQVAKPLLERAFQETYSFELKKLFGDFDLALATYRFSVSRAIPEMTKAAWAAKKKEIIQLQPGMTRRKYVYQLSRADYEKEWAQKYSKPGPGARVLAWVFRIIPKVGPLRALAFRVPTPEAEKLFLASFDQTIDRYRSLLKAVDRGGLALTNQNFDLGRLSHHGEYWLADETYAKLLEQFADSPDQISSDLRANIFNFYDGSSGPSRDKAHAVLVTLKANMGSTN